VPPGRKGHQPGLALAYSSSGRNSWVGVGWSLDAGYIERSTKNGVPAYNTSDTFTFMFQGVSSDLVKIPDGTYRAKDEGLFLKFEDKGVSGWQVRDKSGTIYFFGQTAASQIEDAGRAFRWALDKIQDTNGNIITATYTKSQKQLYINQIAYTGHSTGLAATNQVNFILEPRADIERSYRSGFEVVTAQRLKTIETKVKSGSSWLLCRRFQLGYQYSIRSARSILVSFKQLGTDGTTGLPTTTFSYQDQAPLAPPMTATSVPWNRTHLAGDANGDGFTDRIFFDKTAGIWTVALAGPTGFGTVSQWLSGFGNATAKPIVGDFDGDGPVDVGYYDGTTFRFARSTGAGFTLGPWPNVTIGGGLPLTGDFNGDGRLDIGTFNDGSWTIALATGSTFVVAPGFFTAWGATVYYPLVGDFNGDGLTDIAIRDVTAVGEVRVKLSTGANFAGEALWITDPVNEAVTTADFNGDGLTDLGIYNHATGQVNWAPAGDNRFSPFRAIGPAFNQRTKDDHLQLGDFNGDGMMDFAIYNEGMTTSDVAMSQGTMVDLLWRISNDVGGSTTILYQPSTLASTQGLPKLPFVIPVVRSTSSGDGRGHTIGITTYTFSNGLYDTTSREFRGFGMAQANVAAGGPWTTTAFHQDDQKKGRPFRTEVKDFLGKVWTKQEQTWSAIEPYPGVRVTRLDQSDSYTYDGDATFRQARSRFTYDSYGNIVSAIDDGEVAVSGDERSTVATFVYSTSAWILNKPRLVEIKNATGTVVAQRRFYYDGATSTTTAPTKGNLTKEEEWLSPSTWLATTLTYDSYGNVKTIKDALSRTTTNTYDSDGIYLTKIANALSHTRDLTYDKLHGQVATSKDANGQTTTTVYDPVGRVSKAYGPLDSSTYPTVRYIYVPAYGISKTTACARVVSGQSAELCTDTFTDGLGRTIQVRSPAEDPTKQVISGAVEHNLLGQVDEQWAPYLDFQSSSYRSHTLVSGLAAPVAYTYDVLGRLLTATAPDPAGSAVTSSAYSDWTVTVTDPNGHKVRRTQDVYGRLVKVEEYSGGTVYATTTYQYDARDNLTRVTDAKGNITQITYDSLGRKTAMDDPDMGDWAYTYDSVDNLKTQTDARGVVTTFSYDSLNRLKTKSYAVPSGVPNPGTVTYTYDETARSYPKGRLTKIADGSGTTTFDYDKVGRVIKEIKTLDGRSYAIQRSFDALGQLTSLSYPDGSNATYTYNPQGIETVNLGSGVVVTDVDYNAAGQMVRLAYGNGAATDYTYDPQTLRLVNLLTRNGSGTTLQDLDYTFDKVGNVLQIGDGVGTADATFGYDDLDRLTSASGSYGNQTYQYDQIGNLTRKEAITHTYPAAGAARPHAVTSTSDGWALTYDANGNLKQKVKSGTTVNLVFDAENRLSSVANGSSSSFVYDGDGGRVKVVNGGTTKFLGQAMELGPVPSPAPAPTVVEAEAMPTKTVGSALTGGWNLSANGYLEGPITLSHNGDYDLVITAKGTSLGGVWPTCEVRGDGVLLATLTVNSTSWKPFTVKLTATQGTHTLRLTYPNDASNSSENRNLHLDKASATLVAASTKHIFAGSQRVAAHQPDGTTLVYYTDHLGSSSVITNQTGAVVERVEYKPYGETTVRTGSVNLPQKFTGQRLDSSTGLYFYNARYYEPTLGRFISADPIVVRPGDPQDLNRYAYCRNNPLNRVDPSGHGWFRNFGAALIQIVGIVAAPFTGGASLGLIPIGAAVGAVQAAQAGQFGAWAAGFVVSAAIGFAVPTPTFSNLALQVGVGAARGAALGAISGGIASMAGGSSFGAGARYGALAGAAGGSIGGFIASEQYRILAGRRGFLSHQQLADRQYDQHLRDIESGKISWRTFALYFNEQEQNLLDVGAAGGGGGGSVGNGLKVYRVWGGKSPASGRSWTTTNPNTVSDFRGAAGLPRENAGRFVTEGTLRDATGVKFNPSTYGPDTKPNTAMVPELIVPNPEFQIQIENVSGANPDF
jgi:RHS repeat-associated protein